MMLALSEWGLGDIKQKASRMSRSSTRMPPYCRTRLRDMEPKVRKRGRRTHARSQISGGENFDGQVGVDLADDLSTIAIGEVDVLSKAR